MRRRRRGTGARGAGPRTRTWLGASRMRSCSVASCAASSRAWRGARRGWRRWRTPIRRWRCASPRWRARWRRLIGVTSAPLRWCCATPPRTLSGPSRSTLGRTRASTTRRRGGGRCSYGRRRTTAVLWPPWRSGVPTSIWNSTASSPAPSATASSTQSPSACRTSNATNATTSSTRAASPSGSKSRTNISASSARPSSKSSANPAPTPSPRRRGPTPPRRPRSGPSTTNSTESDEKLD
mmetsp:Transcript_24964/g.83918  ORF Transcript_24964/g.83918 Transcript_24964/m.83918 type:complete len:238 (-) Transcript_24964:56-769(-)